jgi:uncharacterized protein YndB with AHSA1/START domain
MPRSHSRTLDLPLAPAETFTLLVVPSAIRGWWGAARAIVLPREGGVWAAAWGASEDDPDYVTEARIAIFDPPKRLRLSGFTTYARGGSFPFPSELLSTEFSVTPARGGSLLTVVQSGFPDEARADEFFAGCARGWQETFEGIRRYAEAVRAG